MEQHSFTGEAVQAGSTASRWCPPDLGTNNDAVKAFVLFNVLGLPANSFVTVSSFGRCAVMENWTTYKLLCSDMLSFHVIFHSYHNYN